MGILNIFKSNKNSDQVTISKSEFDNLQTIANYTRPQDFTGMTGNTSLSLASNIITPVDLYEMSKYSDILRNVIPTIRNEIFRNGFDILGEETETSLYQKKKIEKIFAKANHNNQTLKEVCMELEDDLQIIDNAYLLAVKKYFINSYNEIIGGEIDELLRIDPLIVEGMFDKAARLGYDLAGNKIYFSIKNRSQILYTEKDSDGLQTLEACYKVKTDDKEGDVAYYDRNEILHLKKYNPSKTYGFSQLYSLYNKVMTLINQDTYIRNYYSGNKVPKGILTVNTTNSNSFTTMWNAFIQKVRKAPHEIHPVINQTNDPGKNAFQFINFMNNLSEMQYTEVRNEMRQQIGALFNVSPLFQNDVSTSGGLNNEGLQITVTNRGVEMGQSIHNEKTLPWIFQTNMNITDFTVCLKPSDEIDELAEKDLRLKDLQIAKATAELGINVFMENDGSFSYDSGKVEIQSSSEPFIPFTQKSLEIKKAAQLPKKEQKVFQTALEKEINQIIKQLDFTSKPSESEMNAVVEKLVKNLNKRLNAKSANIIKAIYDKSKKLVEKELNTKLKTDDRDRNVIEALKRDVRYREAFEGMSKNLSNKLKTTIEQAYEEPGKFTIDNIVKQMKEDLNESENQLRTIARTETSKISIASRKVQYDKTGFVYKYKWIGPEDNRTGEDSRKIKSLTKNGVSWDELVNIIQSVAGEGWVVDKNAPIPRPNTRHTFIVERVRE